MTSQRQKYRLISLLPRDCMSRYFFENFFMYAKSLPVQTKVRFKNLQFLAVAYDMGVLSCAFKQFLETQMTWSQPFIGRESHFNNQNLSFASR